jgi:hypothetical protein
MMEGKECYGATCTCVYSYTGPTCEEVIVEPDVCADAGQALNGHVATWSGKVNVHTQADGSWIVDEDCASGAGVNHLTYCQKFWANTIAVAPLESPTASLKPFHNAGCATEVPHPGTVQFACCRKKKVIGGLDMGL